MSFNIKQASMYDFMLRIEKLLINDEVFMRLLKYPPQWYEDDEGNVTMHDPLDDELPDVVDDSPEYWKLVKDRFRKGTKSTIVEDSSNEKKVIVYMSEGKRRPQFGNYQLAKQQVVFNIYIHEIFESDYRISRIIDRLRYLLLHEHVSGIGKMEDVGGDFKDAPTGYRGYRYSFVFSTKSKGVNENGLS